MRKWKRTHGVRPVRRGTYRPNYQDGVLFAGTLRTENIMQHVLRHPVQSWHGWSRKKKVAVGTLLATLALAGGALAYFAFFGASGSSTGGFGTSGTNNAVLTFTAPPALVPGQVDSVPVRLDNTGNSGPDRVNSVTATVSGTASGCDSSWIHVDTSGLNLPIDVPAGTAANIGSISVSFPDTGTNQSACQSGSYTISLSGS
jgi:hypothetical protein